jgi:hypothetical protein
MALTFPIVYGPSVQATATQVVTPFPFGGSWDSFVEQFKARFQAMDEYFTLPLFSTWSPVGSTRVHRSSTGIST